MIFCSKYFIKSSESFAISYLHARIMTSIYVVILYQWERNNFTGNVFLCHSFLLSNEKLSVNHFFTELWRLTLVTNLCQTAFKNFQCIPRHLEGQAYVQDWAYAQERPEKVLISHLWPARRLCASRTWEVRWSCQPPATHTQSPSAAWEAYWFYSLADH